MNMVDDGGPAFPVWELNGKDQPEMTGFGMTLRDYFAAKAMQGICAHADTWGLATSQKIANSAYELADAMLAARSA